jgi:hypothetical protein
VYWLVRSSYEIMVSLFLCFRFFLLSVGSHAVIHAGMGRVQIVGTGFGMGMGSWFIRVLRLLSGPARSVLGWDGP